MSEKTTFTPVSRNLIKQLEKTNLSKKCILFYSYACRLQAIKNKKSKESENNCLSVPELSKELNLDRKTVKKFCEELVDLGLMYHNVEKSIYENTYQALFLPATAYYENNTWNNEFKEFDGAGDIKHLINLYTKEVKNPKKCQSGFIQVPDEILFAKDLDWNEKTWWFMFYTIDSCYKTYAYNSIKKTFAFSKNKKNTEIYDYIENLIKKGYITSYTATKDGFKITIGTKKNENQPIIERRQYEERKVKHYTEEEILELMKKTKPAEDQLYELLDELSAGKPVEVDKIEESEEKYNKKELEVLEEIEKRKQLEKNMMSKLEECKSIIASGNASEEIFIKCGKLQNKINKNYEEYDNLEFDLYSGMYKLDYKEMEIIQNKIESFDKKIREVNKLPDEEIDEEALNKLLETFEKEDMVKEIKSSSLKIDEEISEDLDDFLESVQA